MIGDILEGVGIGGTAGGLLGGGGGALSGANLGGLFGFLNSTDGFSGLADLGGDIFGGLQKLTGTEKYNPSIPLTDPYRADREQLMGIINQRLAGQRKGAGEQAVTQGLQRNLQNTISAIRSAPGVSPGLKARMISRAMERSGVDVAQKGALMAAQEEQADISQLGRLQQEGLEGYLAPERLRSQIFEQGQERRQQLIRGIGQAVGTAAAGA